ncbi:MAG TPA: nitroreductase family protein [Rectinemataceae bacterium]
MHVMDAIESRRAYRAMDSKPIPEEVLLRLVRSAHLAPSCMNNQPWRILIVSEPSRLDALKASLSPGNYWAKSSPAIAAFVTSPDWDARLDGGRDYALFDLGQAAMAFQLQAVEEGLYVHPIAGFGQALAKEALGIPERLVLEALVVLGYPGDISNLNEKHAQSERGPRVRKSLEDVFAFDTWNARLEPSGK